MNWNKTTTAGFLLNDDIMLLTAVNECTKRNNVFGNLWRLAPAGQHLRSYLLELFACTIRDKDRVLKIYNRFKPSVIFQVDHRHYVIIGVSTSLIGDRC